MFIAIVQHTPVWVWALLAVLVALGLSQTRPREVTLTRVTVLPLVMLALSLSGVFGAFGPLPVPLGAWAAGLAAALVFLRPLLAVPGASWSDVTKRLHLPGSWLPLGLIVGIFAVKYGAGVSLAMQPSLATDPAFAGGCSLAYGLFSGTFLARAQSLRGLASVPRTLQRA